MHYVEGSASHANLVNSNVVRAVRRRGNLNNGANYGPRYVEANNAPSNGNWNYGSGHLPCIQLKSKKTTQYFALIFQGSGNGIEIPSDWNRLGRTFLISLESISVPALVYGSRRDEKGMKRVGHLWEKFCSIENATDAIYRGTQNKRKDGVVVRMFGYTGYNSDHPEGALDPAKVHNYAAALVKELNSGRWNHKPGKKRNIISGGKNREIEIARLKDHIVQWMAILTIEEMETKKMYRHSCGNLPKRGIEDARKTVENWVRSGGCKFFVKLDIRHFYQTVDLRKLSDLLATHIKDKRFLALLDQIVYSAAQWETIFDDPRNLAIGYYSSPWLANIYLTPLDRFVTEALYKERRGKRIRYVKHFLRYVDDLLLMGTSKTDLKKAVKRIMAFCRETLGIEIKPTWEICRIGELLPPDEKGRMKVKPGTKQVDIVGYIFTTTTTRVRDGNFLKIRRLAKRMHRRLKEKGYVVLQNAQAMLSRVGWFSHADSKHFYELYIKPFVNISFIKEIVSYADKNGISGKTARIYCKPGRAEGSYHILYGRCRSAA